MIDRETGAPAVVVVLPELEVEVRCAVRECFEAALQHALRVGRAPVPASVEHQPFERHETPVAGHRLSRGERQELLQHARIQFVALGPPLLIAVNRREQQRRSVFRRERAEQFHRLVEPVELNHQDRAVKPDRGWSARGERAVPGLFESRDHGCVTLPYLSGRLLPDRPVAPKFDQTREYRVRSNDALTPNQVAGLFGARQPGSIGVQTTRQDREPDAQPEQHAGSWDRDRRVVVQIAWHAGELFPRIGFVVTNLKWRSRRVVRFYNKRGTAEQWIKEGKNAVNWTKLSCRRFRNNAARLQLFALAYNLANFVRQLALPKPIRHWSLTTLREKLVKIGAKVVSHSKYVIFQLAEVAVPRTLFAAILTRIGRLRRACDSG